MSRSLNTTEKAQLRAMIARTGLQEVANAIGLNTERRVLISVLGGIVDFEVHGAVEVDLIDFDDLKEDGWGMEARDEEYQKLKRWLKTGKLEE